MGLSQSKLQNLRASGSVVANAATATSTLSLPATLTQRVQLLIKFTQGSLTNATFTPQVSYDGTTFYDVTDPAALTLSADGNKAFVVDCAGAKLFRVSVSSTGTTTSSDCQVDAAYQSSQAPA